jgi:hypothetical protein
VQGSSTRPPSLCTSLLLYYVTSPVVVVVLSPLFVCVDSSIQGDTTKRSVIGKIYIIKRTHADHTVATITTSRSTTWTSPLAVGGVVAAASPVVLIRLVVPHDDLLHLDSSAGHKVHRLRSAQHTCSNICSGTSRSHDEPIIAYA